jgi:hypothetical protein
VNHGHFSGSFWLFFIFNFVLFALIACEMHSFLFIEQALQAHFSMLLLLIVSLDHLCFLFMLFTYSFINNYFFQIFQLLFLPLPTICFIWVIYIITYHFNNLCALPSCIHFKLVLFLFLCFNHSQVLVCKFYNFSIALFVFLLIFVELPHNHSQGALLFGHH